MKVEFIIRNDEEFNYFKGFRNNEAIFVVSTLNATSLEADTLSVILPRLINQGFTSLTIKSIY